LNTLNIITNADLVDITNNVHQSNGTRMFYDNRTGVMYGSYTNGDVRRFIPSDSTKVSYNCYNINNGKIMDSQARLALINQKSTLYLGYRGNQRQRFIQR